MRLSAYVLGRDVAVPESAGDFRSVLTYHASTPSDAFLSLTMPVRTKSYVWDDTLHPVLRPFIFRATSRSTRLRAASRSR
jgi:serine/threonine-protein kinase HipA